MRLGAIKSASLILACLIAYASAAFADSDDAFSKDTVVISAEAGFNHFGPRLATNGYLQSWNFGARLSLLPFSPFRPSVPGHIFDGSLETGLEPVYVRFASQNQNYGGLAIDFRYHLLGLRVGPLVPWINWMGGAGGTDLQVTQLNGPFMFIMQAGAGVECFVTRRTAAYLGYQYTHFSNAGTEGDNAAINSPGGAVGGVSFFLSR